MAEAPGDFDEFLAELADALLVVRTDREGQGVVIEAVTELGGTDLDSLSFVTHFRNERDGSLNVQRWPAMGDIWRDFDSPDEVAVFVINDLHETLFARD